MIYHEGPADQFVTPCCGAVVRSPVYPVRCPCKCAKGLGEVVHAVAKLVAPKKAKECCKCNERRAKLNGVSSQR